MSEKPLKSNSSSTGGAERISKVSLPDTALPARDRRARVWGFVALLVCLGFLFSKSLYDVLRLSLKEEEHSHLLLIPFAAAYLIWLRRPALRETFRSDVHFALLISTAALVALAASFWRQWDYSERLALNVIAFVGSLIAGGYAFFGRRLMQSIAFPVTFLFFFVPLPNGVVDALENASKLASADAADFLFSLSGISYLREGTIFRLPTITLEVAQECSGIRSSIVLFITGAVAANLLLRTTWRRLTLVLFVLPLGVLRNGFRIVTLGLLCTHIGPHMIESDLHHRGGPLFFVLSLIPLLAAMWWLRRNENWENQRLCDSHGEATASK